MVNTVNNNSHAIVCDQQTVITEQDIIAALKGMVEQRFHGVSLYPGSKYFAENMEVIQELRLKLGLAQTQANYKEAARICLRLELSFHYLAPRTTRKIFNTYMQKLNFLMDACRALLNYQKQAA